MLPTTIIDIDIPKKNMPNLHHIEEKIKIYSLITKLLLHCIHVDPKL